MAQVEQPMADDLRPQTTSNATDIGATIALSERRIMGALSTGLDRVTAAIANLTEMHHKALLEQERRNAGFATIERLDMLNAKVETISGELRERKSRVDALEEHVTRLDTTLTATQTTLEQHSSGVLTLALNYVMMFAVSTGGVMLAFILAHLGHL
jgi:chromosome segregation ATPase